MRYYKKLFVDNISTEDITGIVLHSTGLDKILHTRSSALNATLNIGGISQHIYMLDKDNIDFAGNYVIVQQKDFTNVKYVERVIVNADNEVYCQGDKKYSKSLYNIFTIVASTQKLKKVNKISSIFLEEYCKSCGEIKEVEVELELEDNNPEEQDVMYHKERGEYFFETFVNKELHTIYLSHKVRTNSDNEVVVKIERTYTLSEVKELCMDAWRDGNDVGTAACCGPLDSNDGSEFDWIDEFLKS